MLGSKKTIGSTLITVFVIIMLILSQPVSSISLNLLGPSKIGVDDTVKITSEIIIKNIEWVNITEIYLEISGENSIDRLKIPVNLTKNAVIVENLDLMNTGSSILNITVNSSTNAVFGNGFGYAYVFSGPPVVNGSEGIRYGYGYGYGHINESVDALIAYDIFWVGKSSGQFIFKLSLKEGEDNMVFFAEHELTVEAQPSDNTEGDYAITGGGGGYSGFGGSFGGTTILPTTEPVVIQTSHMEIPLPIISKTPEPTPTPEPVGEIQIQPKITKPALIRTDIILTSLVVLSAMSVLFYIYYRR